MLEGPGTAEFDNQAIVSNLEIAAGGHLLVPGSSLFLNQITVDSGGEISGSGAVAGIASANGTIAASGGVLDLSDDLSGTGTLTFNPGGTLFLEGSVAAAESILFNAPNEILGLGTTAVVRAPISGFAAGDFIGLDGQQVTSAIYDPSQHTLAVTGSGGGAYSLDFVGNYQPSSFSITDGAVTVICFLSGTLIGTPTGEVPVERLGVGEFVLTARGVARRVVWIGQGRVLATRGRRNAATPVIVRKGALADNVPYRDLRVTKGHALYIDGVLIPVEFLVNHRSILWDDHAQEVALYHIELEVHDVLLANGAPAESYRDDGNRWLFQNANSGWGSSPQEPCAPVLTGGPVVDVAWRRLLECAGPRPGMPLTDDPDLHLIVDGNRVDAISRSDVWHLFRLAARPLTIRIVSRAAAPQELGLGRDPRCLGVALRQIMVSQGPRTRMIDADDPALTHGFHGFEPDDNIRWTDGDATVPVQLLNDFIGPMDIALCLGCKTRYIDDGMAHQAA
jgi:hypothetical protein